MGRLWSTSKAWGQDEPRHGRLAQGLPCCFPHSCIRGQMPGLIAIDKIITNKLHSHLNAGESYTSLFSARSEISAKDHSASFCGTGSGVPGEWTQALHAPPGQVLRSLRKSARKEGPSSAHLGHLWTRARRSWAKLHPANGDGAHRAQPGPHEAHSTDTGPSPLTVAPEEAGDRRGASRSLGVGWP